MCSLLCMIFALVSCKDENTQPTKPIEEKEVENVDSILAAKPVGVWMRIQSGINQWKLMGSEYIPVYYNDIYVYTSDGSGSVPTKFITPKYIRCNNTDMTIMPGADAGQYQYVQMYDYVDNINLELDYLGQDYQTSIKNMNKISISSVKHMDTIKAKSNSLMISYSGSEGGEARYSLYAYIDDGTGNNKVGVRNKKFQDNGQIIVNAEDFAQFPKGCHIYTLEIGRQQYGMEPGFNDTKFTKQI